MLPITCLGVTRLRGIYISNKDLWGWLPIGPNKGPVVQRNTFLRNGCTGHAKRQARSSINCLGEGRLYDARGKDGGLHHHRNIDDRRTHLRDKEKIDSPSICSDTRTDRHQSYGFKNCIHESPACNWGFRGMHGDVIQLNYEINV